MCRGVGDLRLSAFHSRGHGFVNGQAIDAPKRTRFYQISKRHSRSGPESDGMIGTRLPE